MFSHHLCEKILSHIPLHRRHDLYSLLLTSKSFHAATQPIFYSYNIFTDVRRIQLFTHTLTKISPHLATHVRTFGINLNDHRYRTSDSFLFQQFWDDVKSALGLMSSLETFVLIQISDLKIDFVTRILDHSWSFALKQVKFHLAYDNHVARFLNAQAVAGRLRVVQLYTTVVPPLHSTNDEEDDEKLILPTVDTLDISLSITPYIHVPSIPHLTHFQLLIDTQQSNEISISTLSNNLNNLLSSSQTLLRGFSILEIPSNLSTPLLTHLLTSIPKLSSTLHHLSHFHLPPPYPTHSPIRTQFFSSLISLRRLISIELCLNSWDFSPSSITTTTTTPTPTTTGGPGIPIPPPPPPSANSNSNWNLPSPAAQKALVSELKTYCPSLRIIVFWLGKIRFRWAFVNDGVPIQVAHQPSGHSRIQENETTGGASGGSSGGGGRSTTTMTMTTNPGGSSGTIECVSPRIENAATSGEWHYRMEVNQWPGNSKLWSTC